MHGRVVDWSTTRLNTAFIPIRTPHHLDSPVCGEDPVKEEAEANRLGGGMSGSDLPVMGLS